MYFMIATKKFMNDSKIELSWYEINEKWKIFISRVLKFISSFSLKESFVKPLKNCKLCQYSRLHS